MSREWFYMRLSTQTKGEQGIRQREQSFERQLGIFERCGYVLTEENTFAERVSGKTKNEEREQFAKMLEVLEEGDWVLFSETSRFSRSYIFGMQMLDTLIFEKKVNVKFVSNGIELLADTRYDPYVWYSISQMLLSDELYRRTVSYNTTQGLKRIKERGEKTLGAPPKLSDEQRAEILALKGIKTCKEIGEMYGVNASTISRIK
jgi:DNA invertase Pin-like site-specific DNA recombinase